MDPIEKKANMSPEIFWYKAKDDLLKILLSFVKKKYFSKEKKLFLLSVGTGDSPKQISILNKIGNLDVIDIDEEAIQRIPKNSVQNKFCQDFLKYKTSKKYNIIIMLDVLEHIDGEELALIKLKELLNNNGVVILTLPAYNFLFSDYDIKLKHYRRYTKSIIKQNKHFDVVKIGYWNTILFPLFAVERLYEKWFNKTHKFRNINKYLNKILYFIIFLENCFISKGFNPYFGLSLYCILKPKIYRKN